MKRKIIETGDGSRTLEVEELGETYHSRHGAKQESQHVFIDAGLLPLINCKDIVRILEVGFGTGLNALLTYDALKESNVMIEYIGIEAFPLQIADIDSLNYSGSEALHNVFFSMHASPWEESVQITPQFTLLKRKSRLQNIERVAEGVDLVYYDAFGPRAQPEMWEAPIFKKLFGFMASGGVLVTYCAKGQVRRDMISAGFEVERIAGPAGKRHMLRARKP